MSNGVPPVGTVLDGKYRVERVLGQGGMGCVLVARHLTIDEPVALKLLHGSLAQDGELVLRFQREAKAARKIKSEHAVKILDIGALKDGVPYIVMELLEGVDLDHLLRGGPQPMQLAVDYVLQSLEALAEAHVQGMVHRDLKPANLFVTRHADGSPLVKVLDFGISKVTGHDGADLKLTRTSAGPMGSPIYMAPEQLQGMRGVDARSDIWSLGVILYELLSGNPPFNGNTITELGAHILRAEPPPLRNVPPALDHVVRRCLAKDQAARYRNVAELATDLAPFASRAGQVSVGRVNGVLVMSGATRPSTSSAPTFSQPTQLGTQPTQLAVRAPKPTSPFVYALVAVALFAGVGVAAVVGGWYFYVRSQVAKVPTLTPQPTVPDAGLPDDDELLAPVPDLLTGFYGRPIDIQLKTQTQGATILYSLDDGRPPEWGGHPYEKPITLSTLGTHTLQAVAQKDGKSRAMPGQSYTLSDDGITAPPAFDLGMVGCGATRTRTLKARFNDPSAHVGAVVTNKASPFSVQTSPSDNTSFTITVKVPRAPSSVPGVLDTLFLGAHEKRIRTVTLRAEAEGAVVELVDTSDLDFGAVKLGGTSEPQPVTVRNTTQPDAWVQLRANSTFEVSPSTLLLKGHTKATVQVRFKPSTAGTFASLLEVSLTPDSPPSQCFETLKVQLHGTSR